MKENKITIIINKPIEEVFEFTTNPKNTHLWVPSIEEEVTNEYPPKINTQYKSRGKDSDWNCYRVSELKESKLFKLTKLDESYAVRYTYKKIDDVSTELEYCEQVKDGELETPLTEDTLHQLKLIIESKNNL